MNKSLIVLGAAAGLLCATASAKEGKVLHGVAHLDHVFVIMMENHGYSQIIGNPNAPFINQLAGSANLATNYYAVAHPSLTNYLEAVGASNFGVLSDNDPDWHSKTCQTNLATGVANTDTPASPSICPIAGTGKDAATPAIDTTNETSGPPGNINVDGTVSFAAASTVGKTIVDQIVAAGGTWKSYQESLPVTGPDLVSYSDGLYTNDTDFTTITPTLNPPLVKGNVVKLYAAKHNPFVYFRNVQEGTDPRLSYAQVVDFNALYGDLAAGSVPTYSFIAPNQCNDQHGRGNAGPFCNYDPKSDGSQAGLNPALIQLGDVALQRLVTAIKASPVWHEGRNAIVVLWDENDYSLAPNTNQVVAIVDTSYGHHGVKSDRFYTHFSLVKTLEAGLGLPCLNHACDDDTKLMSDLFGRDDD
jgi:phosphatidylinositol-3-phosphatase